MTSAPLGELAGLCADLARADVFGFGGACITRSCLAIVAGGGSPAAFVHLAVAIVVDLVVASLGSRGEDLIVTSAPFSEGTALCSAFASSNAVGIGRACITGAADTVVDLAVAVVVDTVAGLGRSAARGAAYQFTVFTAQSALTSAVCTRSARSGIAFVRAAVAVVIFSVARLGGGFDLSCASAPFSAITALRASFAEADAFCRAWAGVAGLGLACAAFWRRAATVAAIGVTSRDPARHPAIADLVPCFDVGAGARYVDVFAVWLGLKDL